MKYLKIFLVTFVTCAGIMVGVQDLPQYSNVAGFALACNIEPRNNSIDPSREYYPLDLIILFAVVSPKKLNSQDYRQYKGFEFDYSGRITTSDDRELPYRTVWDMFDRLGLTYQKPENLGLGICPTVCQVKLPGWFGWGSADSAPVCVWSILIRGSNLPLPDVLDAQRRVLRIFETDLPEDYEKLIEFDWFISFSAPIDDKKIDFALLISLYNALHKSNSYCFVPAIAFVPDPSQAYHIYRQRLCAIKYDATLFLPNGESGYIDFSSPRFRRLQSHRQRISCFTYPGCQSFSSVEELVDLARREPTLPEEGIDRMYAKHKETIRRAKREAENNAAFSQRIALVVMPLYVGILCYAFGRLIQYIHSTIF